MMMEKLQKIPPLPATDLANWAPLPKDRQYRALRAFKGAFPSLWYNVFKQWQFDILNISLGSLAANPERPSLESVLENVANQCRQSEDEIRANLWAAEGLWRFAEAHHVRGMMHNIPPLNIGLSQTVSFWLPAALEIDGKPHTLLTDPRRNPRLNHLGLKFAFSARRERFRALDDFRNFKHAILQLKNVQGPREVIARYRDDADLWEFEQLDQMVRQLYAIWREICEERRAEAIKKTGTDDSGLFSN